YELSGGLGVKSLVLSRPGVGKQFSRSRRATSCGRRLGGLHRQAGFELFDPLPEGEKIESEVRLAVFDRGRRRDAFAAVRLHLKQSDGAGAAQSLHVSLGAGEADDPARDAADVTRTLPAGLDAPDIELAALPEGIGAWIGLG